MIPLDIIFVKIRIMGIDNISRDLTFEEFKAYADRKPSLDGKWIYRLEHVIMSGKPSYPQFEVITNEHWFLTHADAERYIKEKLTGGKNAFPGTYSFVITQLAVGQEIWRSVGA